MANLWTIYGWYMVNTWLIYGQFTNDLTAIEPWESWSGRGIIPFCGLTLQKFSECFGTSPMFKNDRYQGKLIE